MPYYIYRVKPFAQLEQLAVFDSFAQASQQAKVLRQQLNVPPAEKVKVMFAEDALQAEDLLCQIRVASPQGDD